MYILFEKLIVILNILKVNSESDIQTTYNDKNMHSVMDAKHAIKTES